ncbi:MAG: PAS domain-containing protein, partial [Acetobacteraceae bacterium]|nr:PAS domain-containing protein [Acetobacteraceae bacterium]
MRLRAILPVAALIGTAPLAALAALLLAGAVAPGPGLLALAGVALAQFGLALVWARDLGRIEAALRRVAEPRDPIPVPALPGLATLLRQAERVRRALLDRADRAEAARRAEAAILEALPDPLLVLGAHHRLRRANAAARREFGLEAAPVLRHPSLHAALDRAEAGGAAQAIELMLPVPVPREWQATVIALDPAAGGGDRFVVWLTDRTRERAVERMRAD